MNSAILCLESQFKDLGRNFKSLSHRLEVEFSSKPQNENPILILQKINSAQSELPKLLERSQKIFEAKQQLMEVISSEILPLSEGLSLLHSTIRMPEKEELKSDREQLSRSIHDIISLWDSQIKGLMDEDDCNNKNSDFQNKKKLRTKIHFSPITEEEIKRLPSTLAFRCSLDDINKAYRIIFTYFNQTTLHLDITPSSARVLSSSSPLRISPPPSNPFNSNVLSRDSLFRLFPPGWPYSVYTSSHRSTIGTGIGVGTELDGGLTHPAVLSLLSLGIIESTSFGVVMK